MEAGCPSLHLLESSVPANWGSFPKPCAQTPSLEARGGEGYTLLLGTKGEQQPVTVSVEGLPLHLFSSRGAVKGPSPAQAWLYLQREVCGGERHGGEADGSLDVVIPPKDGNTLRQSRLERGEPESWGTGRPQGHRAAAHPNTPL